MSGEAVGAAIGLPADLAVGDGARHALADEVGEESGLIATLADLVGGADLAVGVTEEAGATVVEEGGH